VNAPSCASGVFEMNTQVAPWNDVHVRRAVAYALNRKDIIAANGGYAVPNYTLFPPQMLQSVASAAQVNKFLATVPLYKHDGAAAKKELALSKYPHGFSGTLQEYNSGSEPKIVQVIIAQLKQIGINLTDHEQPLVAWSALMTGPVKSRSTAYSYS